MVGLPLVAQYQPAAPGYHYEFPHDYFNHADYQTEWWYYTGNVKSSDGHRFGFELTFFRQGVRREKARVSQWDIHDIYLAHLALSDLDGARFYREERLNRAGPGIAGASEQAARVWNGNWQVRWENDQQHLQAIATNFALRFAMTSRKPPVIHGRNGISQKAAGEGQASHYFSLTRLMTNGFIELNGTRYEVEGTSWMDHEFFTTRDGAQGIGWDWVGLQLDDGAELMLYRFRHKDGHSDPFSAGTYVDVAGKSTFLSSTDFSMEPGNRKYSSPDTHAVYPIAWQINVPSLNLALRVTTPLPSQELVSGMGAELSYWEGAVVISGSRNGRTATGVGYLEMTKPQSFSDTHP
jgi:predicted secreted hydrolase